MKKKYLLIVAGKTISMNSLFFDVHVGYSPVDQRALRFLQEIASGQNYFLQLYTTHVDEFLQHVATSLSVPMVELPFQKYSVGYLVKYLKEHKAFPSSSIVTKTAMQLRSKISHQRYFKRKISVLRLAEAETRNKPKVNNKKD